MEYVKSTGNRASHQLIQKHYEWLIWQTENFLEIRKRTKSKMEYYNIVMYVRIALIYNIVLKTNQKP
jgi:hypothetical protein